MTGIWPEVPAEIMARVEAVRSGRKMQEPPDYFYATADAELSPREVDVLALLADGLRDKEIGSRLEITLFTVKTHVKNILRKLEAENRAHAVAQAFRNGDLV